MTKSNRYPNKTRGEALGYRSDDSIDKRRNRWTGGSKTGQLLLFPLAAGAAVLITFLTVGFYSFKAAAADPVDSLKME